MHWSLNLAGLVHASSADKYACSRWSRAVRFRQEMHSGGRGRSVARQGGAGVGVFGCVCVRRPLSASLLFLMMMGVIVAATMT